MKPVKVAILTSQPRVEKYYDLTTLPDNWELIFFSADFTEEEVLCRAGDADFIFADAIAPVSRNLIEGMPNLKMIHSEGVAYNRYDLCLQQRCRQQRLGCGAYGPAHAGPKPQAHGG